MTNDEGTSWRPLALLAAVIAVVMFVFPLAIPFPLLDPDEGLHASIAQEMVERGHWITPSFLGRPFLDKPIFYFWVQAVSLRLLGPSEAAVRLPGLIFGLLGAVTTGLLAWRMFNRDVGLIAGILYATTILPTALAQAASHDVALVPWVNLTLLLFWESQRVVGRGAKLGCVLGAGLFLGLSILTKGLTGVAVVGVAYGGYLLISRRISLAILLRGVAVLLVAAAVAAPWYLAVETRNPGFLQYYFLDRHLLGFVAGTQPHGDQPWWYYLPILLGGGLPWIGYLPIVVWGSGLGTGDSRLGTGDWGLETGDWGLGTRDSGKTDNQCPESRTPNPEPRTPSPEPRTPNPEPRVPSPAPLLWCWLIGWTVFVTAARSKLVTYLWPAFPPLAILAAVAWARMIGAGTKPLSDAARRAFARTFVWSSLSGPLVLPAAVLIVQWVYAARFSWLVWVAVGTAAAMAPLPLIPWRAGRRQATLAAAALSLAAQFTLVMTMVLPPVADLFSARDLAEHFNRLGQIPSRLLVAEQRIGSLVFYLDPRLRAGLKPGQLQRLFADRPPQLWPGDVIVLPKRKLWRASKYLDLSDTPYESVGRYRLYYIVSPLPLGEG